MSAKFEVVCEVCEDTFEAASPRAKVCGSTCRSRKRRKAKATPPAVSVEQGDEGSRRPKPSGLEASVTRELTAAGVLETVEGQLAVQLARQMSAAGATGISGLSKEFRAVRAEALAQAKTPAAGQGAAPADEPEDEVEKARRRRDEAREAAARQA